MRELRVYGTEEFILKYRYEDEDGEEVCGTYKFDWYKDAREEFDRLSALRDNNELGRNAHVTLTKRIVMNEVLSYFG